MHHVIVPIPHIVPTPPATLGVDLTVHVWFVIYSVESYHLGTTTILKLEASNVFSKVINRYQNKGCTLNIRCQN